MTEKQIRISVPSARDGGPARGTKLSDYLAAAGYPLNAPCGGRGVCGKCRITLTGGTLLCSGTSNNMGHDCVSAPASFLSCRVYLTGEETEILLPENTGGGLTGFSAEAPSGAEKNTETADENAVSAPRFLALDVGTTTLAMVLADGDGHVRSSCARLNPQQSFGADVMTRIGCVMRDETTLGMMQAGLLSAVRDMAETLLRDAAVTAVSAMAVAGNTTMLHLFAGISPAGMGAYPFTPVFLEERILSGAELGLPAENVILLPSADAFIGGDITAGAAASGLMAETGSTLFVDIGTNGEMLLLHNGVLLAASTAAGPALEGAGISTGVGGIAGAVCAVSRSGRSGISIRTIGDRPPVGICGSGLIDLIAVLLDMGIIDETGAMEEDAYVYAHTEDGAPLALNGEDVRAFQLAKSAIRAGMEALCDRAGIESEHLSRILLAGGLGYYMNVASAVRVGLLPCVPLSRIRSVGNTALGGALLRLTDENAGAQMRGIAERCETVELNSSPVFTEQFMEQMMFPEQ
ncbi:MAG: DUF4445 domain-containing protein [Clostridia bacterium]|nr:DUF4445 domain-containing protein [Clostridia bacterium]